MLYESVLSAVMYISSKLKNSLILMGLKKKAIAALRELYQPLAVFVFSRAEISLDFHVYEISAVGIRTIDGAI